MSKDHMRLKGIGELIYEWRRVCINFHLLLLLSIVTVTIQAQNNQSPVVNIGDPAPPLHVREWIKGTPVQHFKKGHVYVIEFWATWCKPCIAVMPHLSALAHEYKDKVTIIGMDIYEKKTTPIENVKAFVDSMGHQMNYPVAVGDSNFMETNWLDATREQRNGIPRSFVVNADGRLAWIGHPKDIDEVLHNIINNIWDINKARNKRILSAKLAELDDSLNYELMRYMGDPYKPDDLGKPDSALLAINEIVRNEPNLKFAPHIAFHTFSSLLKTDPRKAYEYGKVMLVTPTYEDINYGLIIGNIEEYSGKLRLPVEIYELGARAYQAKIDQYGKFGNMNIPKNYKNMAEMYWRANNKLKAIDAIHKAIETLKIEKNFSKKDMTAFESLLQQYKKI